MTVLVITGTGTDVGKTIVTAAVATLAHAAGRRVAVVKPAQTGIAPDEDGDLAVIHRLTGVDDLHEFVRYPDPLAPASAARRAGIPAMPLPDMTRALRAVVDRDLVLVEGAGGLLVQFDDDGCTLADLAAECQAPVLVVVPAGLGTLNATALTTEALRARGLTCLGLVIGADPPTPDLATVENRADLARYAGAPLLGAIPAGAGGLNRAAFLDCARAALDPRLGGSWLPR